MSLRKEYIQYSIQNQIVILAVRPTYFGRESKGLCWTRGECYFAKDVARASGNVISVRDGHRRA